jgi:hypothetical protein
MATKKYLSALALLFAIPFAAAHSDVSDVWGQLGLFDPMQVLLVAGIIFGIGILIAIIGNHKKTKKQHRTILFLLIAVPVIIASAYLAGSTIYLNYASESHGPVHWHADYEIVACGEKVELVKPTGLTNRVGDPTIHEHGDNRMHIEGVLLKLEQASLREYFESIGGEFDGRTLGIPTEHGYMKWADGELCGGRPAYWAVYVNGVQLVENSDEYVIAPYGTVPPGDEIKFVFG